MLKVKESVDLNESLVALGFEKAKDYFHYGNVSVRISDREIVISYTAPASSYPRSGKISINPIIVKMMEKGILYCKD